MDKIRIKVNKAIDSTYSLIAEEKAGDIKKGDCIAVMTEKELVRFYGVSKFGQINFNAEKFYKIREPTEKGIEKYGVETGKLVNWIDGKKEIRDVLDKTPPVAKRVGVCFKKENPAKIYDLVLSDGNIMSNVARVIFDNFRLPTSCYKYRG